MLLPAFFSFSQDVFKSFLTHCLTKAWNVWVNRYGRGRDKNSRGSDMERAKVYDKDWFRVMEGERSGDINHHKVDSNR